MLSHTAGKVTRVWRQNKTGPQVLNFEHLCRASPTYSETKTELCFGVGEKHTEWGGKEIPSLATGMALRTPTDFYRAT